MTKDDLVKQVKLIVSQAREGKLDAAYEGYRALFEDPGFIELRPEDQRQALKLMVHAKVQVREPTPAMIEAHRAAVMPLTELVSRYGEPVDHELLGTCHVLLGNHQSASAIYRAGLALERERNPGSDLCGELMKKISLI